MPLNLKAISTAALMSALLPATSNAAMTEETVNTLVEKFLRENPNVIIESLQNYQIREEVRRMEEQSKKVKALKSVFNDTKKYPVAGNPNGDITLIEFYDYNCPACRMMFNTLDDVIKNDKQVKVIFVEYPIFGKSSDDIAEAAMAVHTLYPEKFFDFHATLMRFEGKMNINDVLNTVEKLGMSRSKVKQEAAKETYDTLRAENRKHAQELDIQGTPAIIVGNKLINSALETGQLKTEIALSRDEEK